MRISDLQVLDRPRERLLAYGPDALSTPELLALVLRHGHRGVSAVELATRLLASYGGVAGLLEALPEELAQEPGVGPAKAAALIAALRLGARERDENDALRTLTRPEDVAAVAEVELVGCRRERVLILICDSGNRLRRVVRLTDGSVDRSLFPVREALNAVLRHDGRAFAVAHNHPSGDPTPSEHDRRATRQLTTGAAAVGLRFLGHVIVVNAPGARPRTPRFVGEGRIEDRRQERV